MGANWKEEQEMKEIQCRENYGDVNDLCYEHRHPLPPHQPSTGHSRLMKCLKWIISQVKDGHEKIKRKSRVMEQLVLTVFPPTPPTPLACIKYRESTMQRRGKGHILEMCNQHVLSIMEMKWNIEGLSGMVNFFFWVLWTTISLRQVHYSSESKSGQLICHDYISHSAETQTQPYSLLCVNAVLVKVYVFIIHWRWHPPCNLEI